MPDLVEKSEKRFPQSTKLIKSELMWLIHHYPLCPFSRKVRLVLGEKQIPHELALAYPWESKPEFVALNPASQTPVAVAQEPPSASQPQGRSIILADSTAIIEYLEETVAEVSVMGAGPLERAEVRRLVAWFDQKFYAEAGVLLLQERMWHRLFHRQPPNTHALRAALAAADEHLDYVDQLIDNRRWLGGNAFSLADMAAAAHLSVADYLGGIEWDRHPSAKVWYLAVRSRRSFRPLLSDRMPGLTPPPHYEKLDF